MPDFSNLHMIHSLLCTPLLPSHSYLRAPKCRFCAQPVLPREAARVARWGRFHTSHFVVCAGEECAEKLEVTVHPLCLCFHSSQ